MNRILLASAIWAVLSISSQAGETTVRLTVRPMAAPKPALKYQLLPEVRELNPGNPVQWYIRCFQEQRNFFFSKGGITERERYRAMPLAELPADKLRNYGGSALTQADWGARLDTPDWEILARVQSGETKLHLAELEPLRILATGLQVRFRGAVAGQRFDDAVSTAKTMFALARHLGECPALTANLRGLSIAELTLDTVEEMEQQPGCPNLYWALTDLPIPVVNLRKGLQGDGVAATADLRRLRDEPMTQDELDEVVKRLSGSIGFVREQTGKPPRSLPAELRSFVKDAEKLRAARGRLIEAGSAESLVRKYPPEQVLLLDMKLDYELRRDERMKLLALTPWQIARIGDEASKPGASGFFADLLPDVVTARTTQARLEQRIAMLRHVEALRLYAAAHDGNLPPKQSDCPVPLPDDPFTGKPFRYESDGAVAHLRGGNIHYEVTIRKKEKLTERRAERRKPPG